QRARRIDEGLLVGLEADPAAGALGARALAAVEGEEARVERREAEAARRAEEALGEKPPAAPPRDRDRAGPAAERARGRGPERGARRVDGADDEVDVVLAVPIEERDLREGDVTAVDPGLAEP